MFEVAVHETFAAGHALRNYRGKCENVHGHNYRVMVTMEGEELDETGMLVDFAEIKRVLRASIAYLDHQFINDLPPFDILNPSAENMAKYFCEEMQKGLEGVTKAPVRIQAVKVWETDTSVATYRP
ncbi:MAG TPA: 6-carboxytetrahydropterin synthase QueD [Bryobacteraceae bacterium]|nr:6-carboxytetrahydropterin synthase QueD [Bryobacteraceae bacterium]